MNVFLGSTGVLLGLSAAVLGSITLVYGLVKKRTDLQWLAVPYTVLIVLGAVMAVFAMERALITRDFTVQFVADNGSSRTPRALQRGHHVGARSRGRSFSGPLILAGYTAVVVAKFRRRLSDPLVGWALLTMFVVRGVLLLPDGRPGQSVQARSVRHRGSTVPVPTRCSRTIR